MTDRQQTAKALLLAGLDDRIPLRSKEAQFLATITFDANPPTEKQLNWLGILVDRYGVTGGVA